MINQSNNIRNNAIIQPTELWMNILTVEHMATTVGLM